MKITYSFVFAAIVSFSTSFAMALSLNDISILLPLPAPDQYSQLVAPTEVGAQGPLIPVFAFQPLPRLVPEFSNPVVYRDMLKLLGVRMDPCFTEGEGPQACRRQVRMVWQPVIAFDTSLTTRDAAVHSFYEFDEATFKQLLAEWKLLSSGQSTDALQIHPQITQEGYAGSYWQSLRAMLLKYCGEKNLVRVTAMNVMNGEMMWIFQGFEVSAGQTTPIKIARTADRIGQGVIVSGSTFSEFSGGMNPPPAQDLDFAALVRDSITARKRFTEDELKKIISKAYDYENPTKHNPGTLDCASCHMAAGARQWAEVNFKTWDWQKEFGNIAFQSTWNLTNQNPGPLRTNRLRAFGYFTNQPAISQRVINETAATMQALQGM